MGRENIKRFEKFLENYSRQGKLSCLFDLVEYLDGVELKYSNTELFWFAVDLSRLLNIFKKLNFKSELRGGKNTLKLSLKW